MTPAERPSAWLLMDREGRVAHRNVYASRLHAEIGADLLAKKGIWRTPEPVWTRAAFEAEMARRADA